MTRPLVVNPEVMDVSRLEMIRHANEALVCWLRDHPGQSVMAGVTACAAGAGLILVAPPIMAAGASMVAIGTGVATLGAWLAGGGVLVGAIGCNANAMRAGLMLGSSVIVGGGAIAGAGIALQAAGVIAATGGGALIAGGVVAAGYGGYRLIRSHRDRAVHGLIPGVQQQLQASGRDPAHAPTVLFDLSQVSNRPTG